MKIIADENIIGLRTYFNADDIELLTFPGRSIDNTSLGNAQALLVRSVTPVNAALLDNSTIRFVASATSGTDHLDLEYLSQQKIASAWAAGANAESVVNYVLSALAVLYRDHGFDWLNASFGIIGAGHIGGRLARLLQTLGIEVKACDPFLDKSTGLPLCSMEETLSCDIVSLHTPLTREGSYPTWHLLAEEELRQLRGDQILINAARGSVIDNKALQTNLQKEAAPRVILDAWENEPSISRTLLASVTLGTPHIAGYSAEGKLRGTEMIYQAFCEAFSRQVELPSPSESPAAALKLQSTAPVALLSEAILAAYDISKEHQACRRLLNMPEEDAAKEFDRQRRDYPRRHEFSHYTLALNEAQRCHKDKLSAMGFNTLLEPAF